MNKSISFNDAITHYEKLRSDIMEQQKTLDNGWAAFVRHGMLAWSLIFNEINKSKYIQGDYNLKSIDPHLNKPIISILANMIHYANGEAHV